MSLRLIISLTLLGCAFRTTIPPAAAAETVQPAKRSTDEAAANDVVEAVYLERIKAAAASDSLDDDRQLVRLILQQAWDSTGDTVLSAALCEKAAAICGERPALADLAAEAMRIMASQSASLRPAALRRLVAMERKRFEASQESRRAAAGGALIGALIDAGDDAAERLDFAPAAQAYDDAAKLAAQLKDAAAERRAGRSGQWVRWRGELQKRIDRVAAGLEQRPRDAGAVQSAALIALAEMDAAAEARPLLPLLTDGELKSIAVLAVKRIDQLKEDEARRLARWLDGQAAGFKEISKVNALRAAIRAWRRVLAEKVDDEEARTALAKAEAQLTEIGEPLRLFGAVKPKATLHEWAPNTNPEPARLVAEGAGFAAVAGIGGFFGGNAEMLKVGLAGDGFWYLAGRGANDSARGDAVSFDFSQGASPAPSFNARVRSIRWRQETPDLRLIHHRDGFCFLSHLQGRFAGSGEKAELVLRDDGYWYLTAHTVQPSLVVEATTVRIDRPDSFTSAVRHHTWRPGSQRIKMIHSDEGFCLISHVQGNLQGGGELVRIRLGDDGFWYLEGTTGQDSLIVGAVSIEYRQ